MYLQENSGKFAVRLDLTECETDNTKPTTSVTLLDFYSTVAGEVEYLSSHHYLKPWNFGDVWDSKCKIWKIVLDYRRRQSFTTNILGENYTRYVYSIETTKWPKDTAEPCMIDCAIPGYCLYDGMCRCINTEAVCPQIRKRPPTSYRSHVELKPQDVLLENSYWFWNFLDAENFAKQREYRLIVDPISPPTKAAIHKKPRDAKFFGLVKALPSSFSEVSELQDVNTTYMNTLVFYPFFQMNGLVMLNVSFGLNIL